MNSVERRVDLRESIVEQCLRREKRRFLKEPVLHTALGELEGDPAETRLDRQATDCPSSAAPSALHTREVA